MELVPKYGSIRDIITILLVVVFVLIVFIKRVDSSRFSLFLKGIFSEKYNNRYSQREFGVLSQFNTMLSVVTYIIFSLLFFQFFIKGLSVDSPLVNNYGLLLIIFASIFLFFSIQSVMLLMLGLVFDKRIIITEFFFNKLYARNYSALIILPLLLLSIYSFLWQNFFLYSALTVFLVAYVLGLLRALYLTSNKYSAKRYYIILYLCALEIAPVIIIAKVLF